MSGWMKWDGEILLWIQERVRAEGLTGVMRAITHLGDAGALWVLLAVVLLMMKRTRRLGAACASALAMGALATNVLLKNAVHRIRPYVALEKLSILVSEPSDFSFPSGHATASFAAAWALFRLAPKKVGVPALVLAALIALSRLYVGVHYPTDVLAGAIIGILAGEISARLIRRERISRIFEK